MKASLGYEVRHASLRHKVKYLILRFLHSFLHSDNNGILLYDTDLVIGLSFTRCLLM